MTTTTTGINRKATTSSVVGTVIEWYDFYLYGTAAALVFGRLFFPSDDPLAGTAAAFATFAVGFVARPVGAAVFGHFGDRIGRKRMLVFSLLGMGIATLIVGLLPTYAAIGGLAPVLLVICRLVQGFCVGGEWGGATLLSVEHASEGRKNFAGAFVQTGSPAGLLLATAMVAIFSSLPEDQFLSWGWRVPFLLSAVLVAVGLFIRLRVEETPDFVQVKDRGRAVKLPLARVLRRSPLQIVVGILLTLAPFGYFYFFATFLLTFGVNRLQFDATTLLLVVAFTAGVEILTLPFAGHLADTYGRNRIFLIGSVSLLVLAFPAVLTLVANPGNVLALTVVMFVAITLAHPLTYALLTTMFVGLFEPEVRYTGMSLAFQVGGVIGGFSPLILTTALSSDSWRLLIPGYLTLLALLTTLAAIGFVLTARRHRDDPASGAPARPGAADGR